MLLLMIIASQFLSIHADRECGVPTLYPKVQANNSEEKLYIFEGRNAARGMFPWVGYIVFGAKTREPDCTVTLVNPRWLITAAHCVIGQCEKDAFVIIGTAKREDMRPFNVYEVDSIFLPKIVDFPNNNQSLIPKHDIAMLMLAQDADISGSNGTINTICLPQPEQNLTGSVYLSGWGLTSKDAVNSADTLKYMKADIQEKCGKDTSKFCVHGVQKGQRTYMGDSGGPAQMLINGKYYLHGALSGGFEDSNVAVYTIVKNYLDWIENLPTNDTITLECKPDEEEGGEEELIQDES